VIVGTASGSAATGKTVAEYFGLAVVVLVVVALLVSGFIEQRNKRRESISGESGRGSE
jgi:hypothetical protein